MNEDNNMGWAYCMRVEDGDLFILYFEIGCPKATLKGTIPKCTYEVSWFDSAAGKWVKSEILESDANGKITMPDFPSGSAISNIDWAVKLKVVHF